MNPARLFYRTHQLWQAMAVRPEDTDMEQAGRLLSPAQQVLFSRLQPAEQVHSLLMLRRLIAQGECHPDLLAAALLHDVGKIIYPLNLWERVWIVLAYALRPAWAKKWGSQSSPPGQRLAAWRRALIVAWQHPGWGADLAAQSGSSPMVVELIRNHHKKPTRPAISLAEILLQKLQAVDNES